MTYRPLIVPTPDELCGPGTLRRLAHDIRSGNQEVSPDWTANLLDIIQDLLNEALEGEGDLGA
jgi:hypothetical protein